MISKDRARGAGFKVWGDGGRGLKGTRKREALGRGVGSEGMALRKILNVSRLKWAENA